MMITLRGLPPDISTTSIRRLIQTKSSVKHVMLDELTMEGDGTQSVIIACMEQKDLSSIFKFFNGAKLGPYVLSVEMYGDGQPNTHIPLYQTNYDSSGNELFERREHFEQFKSSFSEFDGSFAGTPQMVPPPLMETAHMRQTMTPAQMEPSYQVAEYQMTPAYEAASHQVTPAYQVASHQMTPAYEVASHQMTPAYQVDPLTQTGPPRFEKTQHQFMEQENFMPRPGGVGLGASEAILSGAMPPWLRNAGPALDKGFVPRRPAFRERSPRERDSGRGGVRERSRGRSDIRSPIKTRLDPDRRRTDRSPSDRPRTDRPGSERKRDRTQCKRPLSPRPNSSRPSTKVARREPERKPTHLRSVINRPTDRPAPARVQPSLTKKSAKRKYLADLDRPGVMNESVFRVIQNTLGVHTRKNVCKPEFQSMYDALEEAVKLRLREILRSSTVKNEDHLLNLYIEKYPRSTNEMLLKGVCAMINADPKLADEILSHTSVNHESCLAASATIAREVIDPKISNKRLVPLEEKVLFGNLREIINERLKHMVELEKFFSLNAELLVDFYRKKYNTTTDENLISEALSRALASNPRFKYKGKFSKQVKRQLAQSNTIKASEPGKFILSNAPKGSKPNNLVPQNTTNAREPNNMVRQKSTEARELNNLVTQNTTKGIEPNNMVPQKTTEASELGKLVPQNTAKASEPNNMVPQKITEASELSKLVPQNTAKASEPNNMVPQKTTEASQPNNLFPPNTTKTSEPNNLVPQNTIKTSELNNMVPQKTIEASELTNMVPQNTTKASEPNNVVPQNPTRASEPNNLVPKNTTKASEPNSVVPQNTTKASEPNSVVPQNNEPNSVVPQNTTKASEPNSVVPQNTTKASEPNIVVPQNTTQASVPYNLDPEISEYVVINTNKLTRKQRRRLSAKGTSPATENMKAKKTKDDVQISMWKEYTARYIASKLFKDHHLTYFREITAREKNVAIAKLTEMILSSMDSLTTELKGMVSAEQTLRIYRQNYSESDDIELLETVAKHLGKFNKKEMEMPVMTKTVEKVSALPVLKVKPLHMLCFSNATQASVPCNLIPKNTTQASVPCNLVPQISEHVVINTNKSKKKKKKKPALRTSPATENTKTKMTTKDDIRISIWKEYTARSIASTLFECHHHKYNFPMTTAREKNLAIDKLTKLILSSMDTLTTEVEGMTSAEETFRIYREHYSESDDMDLLEAVAKQMKMIRQQMKTVVTTMQKEWPVAKKAIKAPVLKATKQKPHLTTPQQLPQKPVKLPQQFPQKPVKLPQQLPQKPVKLPQQLPQKPVKLPQQLPQKPVKLPQQLTQEPVKFPMSVTKKWADIISHDLVHKAMSSFDTDSKVNLRLKKRLFRIFRKRLCSLLFGKGMRTQMLPGTPVELRQMYHRTYKEWEDTRMVAGIKRKFEIDNDDDDVSIIEIPAALNKDSEIIIIDDDNDEVTFTEDISVDNFTVDQPIQNFISTKTNDNVQEPGPTNKVIQLNQPLPIQGPFEKDVSRENASDVSLRETDVMMVDVSRDAKRNDLNMADVDIHDLEDY